MQSYIWVEYGKHQGQWDTMSSEVDIYRLQDTRFISLF